MRLRLPLHGRSHRHNGSDPLGTDIEFDVDNEGGSLYVQTNDCVDLDTMPDPIAEGGTAGIALEDDSGCGIVIGANDADVKIKARGGSSDVSIVAENEVSAVASSNLLLQSGGGATVTVVDPLFLIATGGTTSATVNVLVKAGCYFIIRNVTGGVVEYLRVGDFGTDVKLLSGGKFRVLNASFSPLFQVDEDGTVHIKTGGTIVADL